MRIAIIDCGTTNSRVYIVDESGTVQAKATKAVGVRNTAISGSRQELLEGVVETYERALHIAGLTEESIRCVLSAGMITSEIGLLEVPHLPAPCSISDLAQSLSRVEDPAVLPLSPPIYFIRGIKNGYDAASASMADVGILDFMRGEEVQVAGLLSRPGFALPAVITILSSHTKYVPVDSEGRILGSITTLSGQLYNAVVKETSVGKSLRAEDSFDDSGYFDRAVVDVAYEWIQQSGFLRALMFPRFLDTLLNVKWYDRRLFAEGLLAAEDMIALRQLKRLAAISRWPFVLIGKASRCRIYEYLLKTRSEMAGAVTSISEDRAIDQLSIDGSLHLARIAKVL
jgi:2-dehydro-3-deoxygalactonokinase